MFHIKHPGLGINLNKHGLRKLNMILDNIIEEMALNRAEWKKMIHVTEHKD